MQVRPLQWSSLKIVISLRMPLKISWLSMIHCRLSPTWNKPSHRIALASTMIWNRIWRLIFTNKKAITKLPKRRLTVVILERFYLDRGAAVAMENRGIVAHWDEKSKQLTMWDTTQAPIPIRNGTAARLGLSDNQVRVIAPFIGGGFGPKIMMFYPEEMLIPWASKKLCRPIKWIEDRRRISMPRLQNGNRYMMSRWLLPRMDGSWV